MHYVLNNALWDELEPRIQAAKRSTTGAKPGLSDRFFLEAVLYRLRTGVAWRDLPGVFLATGMRSTNGRNAGASLGFVYGNRSA